MNKIKPEEITRILSQELSSLDIPTQFEEIGTVLQIGDGIAHIYGLTNAQMGELVEFPNQVQGLILNLEENNVGVIILGSSDKIKEGDTVKRTHKISTIKVGESMTGRIINPLGQPIDGKGPLTGELFDMPLERQAPGVIYREPVTQPLPTGITSIDAMIPIGRGQRELIIGDRQTGKTTIPIDTIINLRHQFEEGDPIHCIYVAIGQKNSTIAQILALLESHGAMDYTTILTASASDPASLQYIAPFAGVALGEYYRDTGRNALIVYDDLSKHAIAYRELSLLLRRPPGREAYPGDIFYLHARLLERAAKISNSEKIAQQMNDIPLSLKGKVKAGGSLTALPIIETQAGDVSAYIPTNVISITDGQIFLDSDLFNANQRPAINIGISVSRVGASAQTIPMKQVARTLKLDQAQFHELESFSKFGSDIDPTTQRIIQRGRKNQEILIQRPYHPIPQPQQIALLYLATNNYLDKVPLRKIKKFKEEYLLDLQKNHSDILQKLSLNEKMDSSTEKTLKNIALDLAKKLQDNDGVNKL